MNLLFLIKSEFISVFIDRQNIATRSIPLKGLRKLLVKPVNLIEISF